MLLGSVHRHPDPVAHASEACLLPPPEEGGQARADTLPDVERPARVRVLQAAGTGLYGAFGCEILS